MVFLVVSADAGHLFERVASAGKTDGHITGADSFATVNPQLAKVDGATIEVRNVGNNQCPLLLPIRNFQPTADNRIVTSNGEATILGTEAERFVEEIGARGKVDGDISSLTQTTHFTSLAYGINEGGVGRDMDVGSVSVQTPQ